MVCFNSLTPGKFEWNLRHVIFKQILVIDGWGISGEIALMWMSVDFADDQSTLVQVMAWCRQATSHYLRQCWPRSLSPYGVTRPQWVKSLRLSDAYMHQIMACCLLAVKPSLEPTLANKCRQHSSWIKIFFIQQNAFENVISTIALILSWPQCIKLIWPISFRVSVFDVSLKLTNLILQPHLPGTNELNHIYFHSLFQSVC